MEDHVGDEIVRKLNKDRDEVNQRMEQLAKIEAKRYELTLGDEQDSLAEIKKDSLQAAEVVEEKQDSLDVLIQEMKKEKFKEPNVPDVEQPEEINESEKFLDELIQEMENGGHKFEEFNELAVEQPEEINESEKEEAQEEREPEKETRER